MGHAHADAGLSAAMWAGGRPPAGDAPLKGHPAVGDGDAGGGLGTQTARIHPCPGERPDGPPERLRSHSSEHRDDHRARLRE